MEMEYGRGSAKLSQLAHPYYLDLVYVSWISPCSEHAVCQILNTDAVFRVGLYVQNKCINLLEVQAGHLGEMSVEDRSAERTRHPTDARRIRIQSPCYVPDHRIRQRRRHLVASSARHLLHPPFIILLPSGYEQWARPSENDEYDVSSSFSSLRHRTNHHFPSCTLFRKVSTCVVRDD